MNREWTVRSALRRGVEVLQEEGLRSLWFKVLGETCYRRALLIERPLDAPVTPVETGVPVAIDQLTPAQVAEYTTFRPQSDPAEVQRRLADGQRCFVARHRGRVVHACWAALHQATIDYLESEIELAPDEVYIYEAFTAPRFRGQNISPARAVAMVRTFRRLGYRRLVAVIVPENQAALRPPEKSGYRAIGTVGTIWLGPWRHDFCRITEAGALPLGASTTDHDATYWDQVAHDLARERHYLDPFLGQMKRRAHLELIERWGGLPAGAWVLKTDLFEEAMGPDAFLHDLGLDGSKAIGMDLSPIIASRAASREEHGSVRAIAADVRHLPFADDALALIVSPSTLDHFADPSDLGRSLRELDRTLASDGRLVVTLDNRQNIFDPLLRLVVRLGLVPYYVGRSYRVDELVAELEAAGLTVQDTTAILHNPRLVATAAVGLARRLNWSPFTRLVQRLLVAAQELEQTRWRYRSGSFVAALATKEKDPIIYEK